jgi:uncharacterized membrane protein YraQ (UPF0718 family)
MSATQSLPPIQQQQHRRRMLEISLAALLAFAIALIFWSQQRYPALLKKLHAGQGVQVKGAISFDALLKNTPQMPAPTRIARTSVNWLWTNRFGMYFALPFGAAIMTLLAQSARPKRFASAPANVLCGAVAGAPLGVCTNCATPIGQSLLVGGASSRLTVAAMISSPSFNPVVVAMAFVLFPLPLAAARIVVPALLLLMLPFLVPETAPALARRKPLAIPGLFPPAEASASLMLDATAADHSGQPIGTRLLKFLTTYLRNLLRLTLLTLPWMLLAAVLGAVAAELVPVYGTHLPVSIFGIFAVAIFGTLLPVPMAFDVALAYVLYRAGVPTPYVAALLCTLGPISIYSLTALGQQLGRRAPLRLAAAIAVLGSLAGILVMLRPVV